MSKQYAHLHAMAKTSVKFQNDWPKTVGGVALTSQLLTNGRVMARLYRTCVLTQVRQKTCYSKCPKILYIKVSDKMVYANSTNPDQTTPGGTVWSQSTLSAMH